MFIYLYLIDIISIIDDHNVKSGLTVSFGGGCSVTYTPEEAKKNLIEVIEIQMEETAKLGTLKDFLELSVCNS